MRKLTETEMKKINGGSEYYVCEETCSGIHRTYKKRHDVLIKGTGATRAAARTSYNNLLESHKRSYTYRDYHHSAQPK